MLKLKLNLVIQTEIDGSAIRIQTGLRVFDLRSLDLARTCVQAGSFGRHSKRKFFLEGVWFPDEESLTLGDWDFLRFPLFDKDIVSLEWVPYLPNEVKDAFQRGWLK